MVLWVQVFFLTYLALDMLHKYGQHFEKKFFGSSHAQIVNNTSVQVFFHIREGMRLIPTTEGWKVQILLMTRFTRNWQYSRNVLFNIIHNIQPKDHSDLPLLIFWLKAFSYSERIEATWWALELDASIKSKQSSAIKRYEITGPLGELERPLRALSTCFFLNQSIKAFSTK